MFMDDRVLKSDDLIKIAQSLKKLGYEDSGLIISIPIRTKILLNRLNESYYRKLGGNTDKIDDVNEVNVSIYGINFKYYLIEDNNDKDN